MGSCSWFSWGGLEQLPRPPAADSGLLAAAASSALSGVSAPEAAAPRCCLGLREPELEAEQLEGDSWVCLVSSCSQDRGARWGEAALLQWAASMLRGWLLLLLLLLVAS